MKTPALALAVVLFNTMAVSAQVVKVTVKPLTDEDIKLIRQDIQTAKDDIIKDTMQFTEAEGTAFWPVYREYAGEQRAIADKRLTVILDYAKNVDTLTNSDASSLTQRLFQVEDDTQALRKKYFFLKAWVSSSTWNSLWVRLLASGFVKVSMFFA